MKSARRAPPAQRQVEKCASCGNLDRRRALAAHVALLRHHRAPTRRPRASPLQPLIETQSLELRAVVLHRMAGQADALAELGMGQPAPLSTAIEFPILHPDQLRLRREHGRGPHRAGICWSETFRRGKPPSRRSIGIHPAGSRAESGDEQRARGRVGPPCEPRLFYVPFRRSPSRRPPAHPILHLPSQRARVVRGAAPRWASFPTVNRAGCLKPLRHPDPHHPHTVPFNRLRGPWPLPGPQRRGPRTPCSARVGAFPAACRTCTPGRPSSAFCRQRCKRRL